MNRTITRRRNTRIVKVKRTRDGSIHKILKKPSVVQPRVRIVTIRKRKVSGDDQFSSKKKRVCLSESRSIMSHRIVLPYEGTKNKEATADKHLVFFKTLPSTKLDA